MYVIFIAGVPYDGSIRIDIHENSLAIGLIFYTLAGIGMLFTLACLVFNIVFRNKKYSATIGYYCSNTDYIFSLSS